jgi:hypothetical protein
LASASNEERRRESNGVIRAQRMPQNERGNLSDDRGPDFDDLELREVACEAAEDGISLDLRDGAEPRRSPRAPRTRCALPSPHSRGLLP